MNPARVKARGISAARPTPRRRRPRVKLQRRRPTSRGSTATTIWSVRRVRSLAAKKALSAMLGLGALRLEAPGLAVGKREEDGVPRLRRGDPGGEVEADRGLPGGHALAGEHVLARELAAVRRELPAALVKQAEGAHVAVVPGAQALPAGLFAALDGDRAPARAGSPGRAGAGGDGRGSSRCRNRKA